MTKKAKTSVDIKKIKEAKKIGLTHKTVNLGIKEFEIGDSVTVTDRGMKTNGFSGKIIGLEPNTDAKVYNVEIQMRDKEFKETKEKKIFNYLERQLTKDTDV